MKLSKFKEQNGGGSKTVPSPSYGSYADIKSGGRFVQSYNPTTALRSADITLCKSLDATYRMKDDITEESVMEYFNEMLQDFTDDDDSHSVIGKNDTTQLKTSHLVQEKKNHLTNEQEFYFKKDTSAAPPKIYDIAFTPSKKSKKVSKSKTKSTPKTKSSSNPLSLSTIPTTVIESSTKQPQKPIAVKLPPPPKDNKQNTPQNETQTTIHTTKVIPSTKLQPHSEINKTEISIKKMPIVQFTEIQKPSNTSFSQHDNVQQRNEIKRAVSVRHDLDPPKTKHSSRHSKIGVNVKRSVSTLPPKQKFDTKSSVGSHGNTSLSSGNASIRSFEISIQSSGGSGGGSLRQSLQERTVKETTGDSTRSQKSTTSVKEAVPTPTTLKKEKRKNSGQKKQYKIEIFKSEPVPTN